MKYTEFHRKIVSHGWKFSHAEGSHRFYKKEGKHRLLCLTMARRRCQNH
ncbi:MAG: hypothetical protein LUD17_15890 [Bacteroidales bacterium]|nr:hypothetical protein [Bacteroidales bacterium]